MSVRACDAVGCLARRMRTLGNVTRDSHSKKWILEERGLVAEEVV